MGRALSMDLRERIAAAYVAEELTIPEIAERFSVSTRTVERLGRLVRNDESLEPKKAPGPAFLLDKEDRAWLAEQIRRDPFMSSYALSDAFAAAFPERAVHRSTILRAMHALGMSSKKKRR